jgi:hypothetical protein
MFTPQKRKVKNKAEQKVKSLGLIKHHAMKMYGGVGVQLPAFFTSAMDGGKW